MKKIPLGIALAGTLFCAGCLHTVDTVENAEKYAVPNEILRKHVETDASQPIKVTNLVDSFAPNGFRMIAVELTNTSSSPRSVFVRCEWYDEAGMKIETSLAQWNEYRFNARDSKQFRYHAPKANALDFKIRLSEDPR